MKIYAHRGVSARHPENTLQAFQAALDADVYGIELDIHCSKDGVPVVIHDDQLDRTTNGKGLVTERPLAQLQMLDAGNGQPVPTFDDVLSLVGNRLHFDIEIKGQGCERAVLDALHAHPGSRAAISSFDWDILSRVRSLEPERELWVLSPTIDDAAIAKAIELRAPALAVHYLAISASTMRKATQAGMWIMAWTVNSQTEADRLRSLGVKAMCTDDPIEIH